MPKIVPPEIFDSRTFQCCVPRFGADLRDAFASKGKDMNWILPDLIGDTGKPIVGRLHLTSTIAALFLNVFFKQTFRSQTRNFYWAGGSSALS